jgi:hypothetical protein
MLAENLRGSRALVNAKRGLALKVHLSPRPDPSDSPITTTGISMIISYCSKAFTHAIRLFFQYLYRFWTMIKNSDMAPRAGPFSICLLVATSKEPQSSSTIWELCFCDILLMSDSKHHVKETSILPLQII